MKKALIQDTRICDIVDEGKEFEVHSSLKWVEVPDDTTQIDTYVDGSVVKYEHIVTSDDGWKFLRLERDNKLADTDWRAGQDLTMSDEWKTYRQELRDLPSKYNDTTVKGTITWPTEPS